MIKPDNWDDLMFCEKIYIYRNYLNETHALYTDKLSAKRIVKDICGDRIRVAKVIRVLEGPDDLVQSDLDPCNIIKSAHGSGWNITITENTDIEKCKRLLRSWNICYSTAEKQYTYIKPKFFIEEKIKDKLLGQTGDAVVYMIRCIRGKPISIGIKYKRCMNNYDMGLNILETGSEKLPFQVDFDDIGINDMLQLARLLSEPFEFVRIDFYVSEGGIFFSEFTFTPNGGNRVFTKEVEYALGKLWD